MAAAEQTALTLDDARRILAEVGAPCVADLGISVEADASTCVPHGEYT